MKVAVLSVATAVAVAAAVGFFWWVVARVKGRIDRRKVYKWLHANTRDEPGESHVNTQTLAKGTGLPEERVRIACMSDHRIFRAEDPPECWSIWRAEKQSIYDKRGLLRF